MEKETRVILTLLPYSHFPHMRMRTMGLSCAPGGRGGDDASPAGECSGPSAGTTALDGIEGCPPSFLVPGFHDGLGDLAACRQGEGRSQEKVLLLVLSPPLPASLTCSTGPKQRSCKPAFVGSEEHSIWAETYLFFPFLKVFELVPIDGWESE